MPLRVLRNEPVRVPQPGEAPVPDAPASAEPSTPAAETVPQTVTAPTASPAVEPVPVPTAPEETPVPAALPDPAPTSATPAVVPAAPAVPAPAVPTGLTAADKAAWGALFDRLFDTDCTEVNILANDLADPTPYHVVVNVNTRYYDEADIVFESEESLRRVIDAFILPNTNLDVPAGKGLPPIVDGTFIITDTYDGVTEDVRARLQILSPPATYRTELHFCKLPRTDIGLETLIDNGTLPVDIAYFLSSATKAGLNIVFSGIPNTGKTTVLNACTYEIPTSEKVAVIQDVDELILPHLRTKQKLFTHRAVAKDLDGVSDGSASALIEVVKRTRPTRLFTGECRSGEMYDHLEASSIFHGCMTTLHAASAEQALNNIQNMALKNQYAPGVEGVRALIASGVDLVVQLGLYQERRIVTEVLELDGTMTDTGVLRRNFLWQFNTDTGTWVKGNAGLSDRTLRKLADAGEPDFWRNPPQLD